MTLKTAEILIPLQMRHRDATDRKKQCPHQDRVLRYINSICYSMNHCFGTLTFDDKQHKRDPIGLPQLETNKIFNNVLQFLLYLTMI